ncbi:MAG TPA: DUF4233 domain-containing protein [Jatrophihabitantaceae bacterium]|nr:DUF4233 domain-containing protein [Jatrophihabitantaceae bacterium]
MTDPHDDASHDSSHDEPTPEQVAERAKRADKATRSALAGVLGLEAVVVLLVPRAIAFTETGLGTARTVALVVLAVLMVLAAAGVRRTWGIGAGSVLQLLLVLTGVWLAAMFFLGAVFAAIWLYLLSLRHELVGTPGGARMLVS